MRKIVFIDIALFVVLMGLFLLLKQPEKAKIESYDIERVVQYGYKLENRSNQVSKDVNFWTYVPVKFTSTQKLQSISVSHPYTLIEDDYGNQVIHIHFDAIAPFASKIIDIQAVLAMSNHPNKVPLKQKNAFLSDEKFIQVNHPDIRKAAARFAISSVDDIEAIYAWTSKHIHGVKYVREDRGALYALNNKAGDCTEYAYLFTALCRVNKVPARVLGGYVLNENGKLRAEAYHNWAEFYVDGMWHVADPQLEVFDEKASRFITMNVISDKVVNPMGKYQRFKFTGNHIFATMR